MARGVVETVRNLMMEYGIVVPTGFRAAEILAMTPGARNDDASGIM
jgi:hypothetical protein